MKTDWATFLMGTMLGASLMGLAVSMPSCSDTWKVDDMDPDRPARIVNARMTVVMPYEVQSQIEITRDGVTGRLCYSAIGTTGAAAIWCESSASTLPDAMRVSP